MLCLSRDAEIRENKVKEALRIPQRQRNNSKNNRQKAIPGSRTEVQRQ